MRSAVVLALAVLAVVVVAEFPCGTLYGWAPSDDATGYNVQSLELSTGDASDLSLIEYDSDSEFSTGVVYGRSSRVIYVVTSENIYQYQIDLGKVISTVPIDNQDGAFLPYGYDDVHGHVWGTYDEFGFNYLARLNPNTGNMDVSSYPVMEGANLYFSEDTRTIYQVAAEDDGEGGSELIVETDIFTMDPIVNFTYPIYFPNSAIFTPQTAHTLPNGGVLATDGTNFYLVSLGNNGGEGQLAAGLAATTDTFEPFDTPFYNFVIGFYSGDQFSCDDDPSGPCFAFWDSLTGDFFPFNVTISDPSGESIGRVTSIVYDAMDC